MRAKPGDALAPDVFGPRRHGPALLLVATLLLASVAPVAAVGPPAPAGSPVPAGPPAPAGHQSPVSSLPSHGRPIPAGLPATDSPSVADRPDVDVSPVIRATTRGAPAIDDTAAAVAIARQTTDDEIRVATELSLTPNRPGAIGVAHAFTVPARVTALSVTLPDGATVTRANGFSRADDGTWEWTGRESPTLRYRHPVNETAREGGPLAGSGSYVFADAGDWALVRRPSVGLRWQQRGTDPVTVSRSADVDGEGVVGGNTAFLGPHQVLTHRAHDQTFRLVVPAAANMAEDPEAVFSALERASGALHVGDRDDTVFVVVAPTGDVDWAVQGLQIGDRDVWVGDDERVDDVENVWVHEYVHTRQSFTAEPSARWLTEATATWYAARFALRGGGVDYETFASFLERGEEGPQGRSVLADPSSWRSSAQYLKGALVAGDVDRRIRVASDGNASLQTVLRWLNGHSGPVDDDAFLAAVAEAGGDDTRESARRFTTTSEAPEMWDRSAHAAAFESTSARVRVHLDAEGVRVSGPYREGRLSHPVVVAAGETLSLPIRVENLGGAAGDYRVVLRVDDAVAATAAGELAAGGAATVRLNHTVERPGEYVLSIAGERLAVAAVEPAEPTVREVRVERDAVPSGERVQVTAVVENGDRVPGTAEVEFTRDGAVVATREVTLGAGESTKVTVPIRLTGSGTHRVGAGGVTVDVAATDATSGTRDGENGDRPAVPVPGFGAGAAVLAVLAAALVGRYRA